MTKKRDRIFAFLGALLFLVTASTLTVAVVYSAVTQKGDQQPAAQAQTCADNQTELTLDKPAPYKVDGDVTAVQTTDLEKGSGPVIKQGDCVVAKYYGMLAKTGKEFDENFSQPTALVFNYDTGRVIPGMDEGMNGMQVGGVRRIVIPSEKAYKDADMGNIPPNSDLVFIIKILRIQK